MVKKREYASDSDVSKFITRKNAPDNYDDTEKPAKPKRKQFMAHLYAEDIAQLKIIAQLKKTSVTSLIATIIHEEVAKEKNQAIIKAYEDFIEKLRLIDA